MLTKILLWAKTKSLSLFMHICIHVSKKMMDGALVGPQTQGHTQPPDPYLDTKSTAKSFGSV